MGKKRTEHPEASDATRVDQGIEDRERIQAIRKAAAELEIPREMADHLVVQGVSIEEATGLMESYQARGFAGRGAHQWGEERRA